MARTEKSGLDYFSHDTDLFEDRKVKFLKAKHKLIGYAVYMRLLENIYKENGYYIEFNERDLIMFSDENYLDTNLCKDIIDICLDENLFDKALFNKYKILTSKRIQKNYLKGCEKRKSILLIEDFLLVNPFEILGEKPKLKIDISPLDKINSINVGINRINDGINQIDSGINSQRKVKESKVNNISTETVETEINSGRNDFIGELLEIFCEEYETNRGFQFELINPGKERKAIGKLLSTYKQKNKDSPKTSEETKKDFRNYFKACLIIPDNWMRENMSPTLIISKFNEIKTLLRKTNGTNKTNGATTEGIMSAIIKNFSEHTGVSSN